MKRNRARKTFFDWDVNMVAKNQIDNTGFDVMDYLNKGKKIVTLAKKKFNGKEFVVDDFLKKIKLTGINYDDVVKQLAKLKYKKSVFEGDLKGMEVNFIPFFSEFKIRKNEEVDAIAYKSSRKGVDIQYTINACDYEGNRYLYVCGNTGCKNSQKGHWYVFKSSGNFVGLCEDLPTFLAKIELHNIVQKAIITNDIDFSDFLPDMSKIYIIQNEVEKYEEWKEKFPIFGLPESAREVLGNGAIPIENVVELLTLCFLKKLPNLARVKLGNYDFYDVNFSYNYKSLIEKVLESIVFHIDANKRNNNYCSNMKSCYARSFETKKNIPKEVVYQMQQSKFNDYFGFVEFDELVDSKKISEIEKEFRAFELKVYERIIENKDAVLRFRRLGHHKASGLYYPEFNCICVDIDNPSSLLHEYGHMLDYMNGKISEKGSFKPIIILYKEKFLDGLKKEKIELKGKYDTDYYMTPTEIFARSFEMYLKKILKIDNSILGTCEGFSYPDDEEYLLMIKKFFSDFLVKVKEETNE